VNQGWIPPVDDLLEYLQEIGFEELYLPQGTSQAGASRPQEQASLKVHSKNAEDRKSRLAELARESQTCSLCNLSQRRQKVVFGSGDPDADLMFIGEGPGAEEDRQGLPFVGRAGELLTKIIQAIGFERETVYIANIVKCRPPGNRDPQPEEVASCRRYLEQQIDLIQPKVIVLLGRVAAQTLLGNDLTLGRMRGEWYRVRGVETRVTYHPAALLRNASFKRPTWEDMQVVRDRLAEVTGG